MKVVVYGDERRVGLIVGDRILDLRQAAASGRAKVAPQTFHALQDFIDGGKAALEGAQKMVDELSGSDDPSIFVDLASTRLHAPYPGGKFAMAGGNFAAHMANTFTTHGQPITAEEMHAKIRKGPPGGFWSVIPPVGPGEEIPMPLSSDGLFDYESELAIVLATGGKRIKADQWEEQVWGAMLVLDWSVRAKKFPSPFPPFYGHKVFDASKTIGPFIAVGEIDPANSQIQTIVNGEVRQDFNTSEMVHSFGELLEQISGDVTMVPGDLVSSGTGSGTAIEVSVADEDGVIPLDLYLKPGDRVEARSVGLGSLSAVIVES